MCLLGSPEVGRKRYRYHSNSIMKTATAISSSLLIVGGVHVGPSTVQAFHLPMTPRSCLGTHHSVIDATCTTTSSTALASSANDDGDLDMEFEVRSSSSFRPETSFGAEAVPEEQRPANEYLDLIRQPLFGWASQETGSSGLTIRLAATYVGFYALVCYPIAAATYTLDGYFIQTAAAANVGAVTVLLILMLRLFSGWGYVGSRLQSKVIEFEETGWYDGDIELKTEAEKARDMFLYRSDVKPVEDRLKLFSAAIAALWLASIVGFNVAISNKPLFDEYNPEMLKTLQYDDKVAGIAAQQSGGVPTYCNSRYYRAVANGGQGCK